MQIATRSPFTTITTEGAILPAELLQRVHEGRDLDGLRSEDYHLAKGERINEAINRAWNRCLGAWHGFDELRAGLPEAESGTSETRERWLLILFQELGYGRLRFEGGVEVNGERYAISHRWGPTPIHLVTFRQDLDRRGEVVGARSASPHSLVQEMLNRDDRALWGFVSNGLRLRILRDNASLTRAAFLEFDLEALMSGEQYSDFSMLWLLCHQSRVEAETQSECWLEQWSQAAAEQGVRALDVLRDGVQEAIATLGGGFLRHSANHDLREALQSGALDKQDYYRQLLRMVYRLIFLFVAEDRDLLLSPDATPEARRGYSAHYSLARLRELAGTLRGGKHGDLYRGLRQVLALLREGYAPLGLPALGGLLFSDRATPDLDAAELANRELLGAVRELAFVVEGKVRRGVDYRNLGAEEMGSVYESLLELQPELDARSGDFALRAVGGSERKTTGSYYTPSSLIKLLLDSALEPVVEERLAAAGDDRDARARALLDLDVVDPACGSGHFLVAAAHRLAHHLARERTSDDEPGPAARRAAMRDVVRHCIYGVDVNPMAAELCKVSLWMEAVEPGKPLSFLDHHIQVGNSLIGATPEGIADGIPDGAFHAVLGDDKKACTELRKRNRGERKPWGPLFAQQDKAEQAQLREAAAELIELPEEDQADIERKAEAFRALVDSEAHRRKRLVADTWCAAFFIRKHFAGDGLETRAVGITQALVDAIAQEEVGEKQAGMIEEVEALAEEHQFFHWHLAFPHVFAVGGFDLVVGNPPWERVKIQEKEWFATHEPEIAEAKNAAARKKLIRALPDTDPLLAKKWAAAQRAAANVSNFLRKSERYPLGGVGDVNVYAVFADLARQLINGRGAASMIVPTGLVTGFTYRGFLQHLLERRGLAAFYGFENEDLLFPDITNKNKYGIVTMVGTDRTVLAPKLTANIRQPTQAADPERRYSLTVEQIEAINPNTLNLPAFRWARDAEVTAAIHEAAPVLVRKHEDGAEENPWGVDFKRMLDMANDSDKFIDHEAIRHRIVRREAAKAVLDDGREVYPLYEGKMFWHFDHRYGTYADQTQKQANKGVLPHVGDREHDDPEYRVEPRYWVDAGEVAEAAPETGGRAWFFAWRDVGPAERSLVITALPWTAVGHQAPVLHSNREHRDAVALLGVMSSLVVDYDARQRSHRMMLYIVEQLAVLAPDQLAEHRPWLGSSATDWLVPRVLELCYTNVELEAFARDLGCELPPFHWQPERRRFMQAEIDAAVLHLYGLSRDQAEWLIDSFTVLRKYEERDHGEFVTKRLVLEIYDGMAEAREAGGVYESRVEPPPGDGRCCHRAEVHQDTTSSD